MPLTTLDAWISSLCIASQWHCLRGLITQLSLKLQTAAPHERKVTTPGRLKATHHAGAGVVRRLSENGALSPADSLTPAASGTLDGMSDVDRKQRELYTRQQQLLREQRTADQEKLLATISGGCFHQLTVPALLWLCFTGLY